MEEEPIIPKVLFDENQDLRIEVMSFAQLLEKLNQSENHNPFSVHKIEFYLILIVTKGSYLHFVDFKSYSLIEGSALFVAKNQVHHFNRELKEAEGIGIVFNSLFVDRYHTSSAKHKLNRLFNYHIETPVIHQKELGQDSFIEIALHLYKEYTFPNAFGKAEMLSSLLQVVLLKAERAKEFQSIRGIKNHWLETFNSFKDLLETGYIKTRNSNNYATDLHVSYKFLNDVVKKISGKTAKAFIDDFVTTEIKRYLVSTPLSVKEVSYQTGFDEPANMVKFFKKHAGITPLKFRQEP